MEDSLDLYDDIFDQNKDQQYADAEISDLYDNIHNPEVAETALEKVKGLTSENEKYKNQNAELKRQISILNNINLELKTRNTHLEKNVKSLIETSRVEINRKNEQIRSLRAEMENILFKRVARNINRKELEDLLKKYQFKDEPYAKLPTKPKQLLQKQTPVLASPDLNTGNRQFVRKRKRMSLEDTTTMKRVKIGDNKENVVDNGIKPTVMEKTEKGDHKNDNCDNAMSSQLGESNKAAISKQDVSNVSKVGQNLQNKPGNMDVGLISNYVKSKPRKSRKEVPGEDTNRGTDHSHDSVVSSDTPQVNKNSENLPDPAIDQVKIAASSTATKRSELSINAHTSKTPIQVLSKTNPLPKGPETKSSETNEVNVKLNQGKTIEKSGVSVETRVDAEEPDLKKGSEKLVPATTKNVAVADSENNSSVSKADSEASTSSKLKSPVSKPKLQKTPQEWALGHELFGSYEERPKVKSKKKVKEHDIEKKVEKCDTDTKVEKQREGAKVVVKSIKENDNQKVNPGATDAVKSPESYGSSRWQCDLHKIGFRTREELRSHRNKEKCLKRAASEDSPKKTPVATKTVGESAKTRVPSGDQKDFGCEDPNKASKNKGRKNNDRCEEPRIRSRDRKVKTQVDQKHSRRSQSLSPARLRPRSRSSKEESKELEESGIIQTPVAIKSYNLEKKKIHSKKEESKDLERTVSPVDDVLELGIGAADSFDDELDFEPEDTEEKGEGKNVYFKNLDTNFSIPKTNKCKADEKLIKSSTSNEREQEKMKKERPEVRSRSRNRRVKSKERNRRGSRPRRRSRSRSHSRRRRSKSRNRSRSRNRLRKSPRKRSPSRERGRNRRRSSKSRNLVESRSKCKEPRSLSRDRSRERKQRHPSKSRIEKLSRRSQSLSPERLRSCSPELDLESINVDDHMSLSSLQKIKEKLMGKMSLDEDLNPLNEAPKDFEEGEITDSEDEEVKGIIENNGVVDLRAKLQKKTKDKTKSNIESDKENEVHIKHVPKDGRITETIGIKACLKEYSAEDIENKLIPFKKRQFHELHIEELKIKKQIERARSKSNTPVRSVSESSASDFPLNNSAPNVSTSTVVDTAIVDNSPIPTKSPVTRGRRVSRNNSRSDAPCGQGVGVPSNDETDKKVSPIKLSLKGVVIERPSSSSCSSEAFAENVEVILEKVEQNNQEENMRLGQDDNAVFHTTPPKPSRTTDVAKDLFLTDDSDIEESPVKVHKDPSSFISPFRKPEGPLDLSSPKRASITPKTSARSRDPDISSPQGISELLKSPLVNNSILSPHTKYVSSKDNFVTSTPCASASTITVVTSSSKVSTSPLIKSPRKSDHVPSDPSKSALTSPGKRKKKTRLSRSVTNSVTSS